VTVRVDEDVLRVRREHLETRTLVLAEHKLLYLPVPKTAWTSMLWLVAELAGIPEERFYRSLKSEVTNSLSNHDMKTWGEHGRRLTDLSPEDRERALNEDGWLRFSVVREPAERLWSAWQSKLLMREPTYVRWFGVASWFPRIPETADDVLTDFRTFVGVLAEKFAKGEFRDPHWRPQHDLVDSLPINHIGYVDRLDETVATLREHVGDHPAFAHGLRRENRMLLRYHPVVYDAAAATTVREVFAGDVERFGFPPFAPVDDVEALGEWKRRTEEQLPVLHQLVARHERMLNYEAAVQARDEQRLQQIAELNERLAQAETGRRRAEVGAAEIERVLEVTETKLDKARARAARAAGKADKQKARADRILGSFSWRVTAPLRALRRRVGGVPRR
jgi:hypothetical protein